MPFSPWTVGLTGPWVLRGAGRVSFFGRGRALWVRLRGPWICQANLWKSRKVFLKKEGGAKSFQKSDNLRVWWDGVDHLGVLVDRSHAPGERS